MTHVVLVVARRAQWSQLSFRPLFLWHTVARHTVVAEPTRPQPTINAGANECRSVTITRDLKDGHLKLTLGPLANGAKQAGVWWLGQTLEVR